MAEMTSTPATSWKAAVGDRRLCRFSCPSCCSLMHRAPDVPACRPDMLPAHDLLPPPNASCSAKVASQQGSSRVPLTIAV